MSTILDIPMTYEEEGYTPITRTLRQQIQRIIDDKGGLLLIPEFIKIAKKLMIERSEYVLTEVEAEIFLFNEIREVFGQELTTKIFEHTAESEKFSKELADAYNNGDFEKFVYEHSTRSIRVNWDDSESIQNAVDSIKDLYNDNSGHEPKLKDTRDMLPKNPNVN